MAPTLRYFRGMGKTKQGKIKPKRLKRSEQLLLDVLFKKQEMAFGGILLKGNNAKRTRPLNTQSPTFYIVTGKQIGRAHV